MATSAASPRVAAGSVTFLWGARTLARFRPSLTRPGALGGPR